MTQSQCQKFHWPQLHMDAFIQCSDYNPKVLLLTDHKSLGWLSVRRLTVFRWVWADQLASLISFHFSIRSEGPEENFMPWGEDIKYDCMMTPGQVMRVLPHHCTSTNVETIGVHVWKPTIIHPCQWEICMESSWRRGMIHGYNA